MNKPQCNSAADCLRELARVMEQFGIKYPLDAINSGYIRYKLSNRHWQALPEFSEPDYWEFAIAEVEGKPVFIGDTLYCNDTEFKVAYASESTVYGAIGIATQYATSISKCSWNQPKPKTVMIEMLAKDADYFKGAFTSPQLTRLAGKCKKALEELK